MTTTLTSCSVKMKPLQTTKKIFNFIKSTKCERTNIAPVKREGFLHHDATTKANILNQQFASVFTEENTVQDLAADLDKGRQIDAVLLDFSKAFDKDHHDVFS